MTSWPVACQAPLSMGFSRQEYWSGLPVPSPGDLPDARTELMSSASPSGRFFINVPPRKPGIFEHNIIALIGTLGPIIKIKYLNKFP